MKEQTFFHSVAGKFYRKVHKDESAKARKALRTLRIPGTRIIDAGWRRVNVYATFINRLNPKIERLNRELCGVAYAQPEDIPKQTQTGKPLASSAFKALSVITEGAIQIELGKDCCLSFKDNMNAGGADCTISRRRTVQRKKKHHFRHRTRKAAINPYLKTNNLQIK
jgi:hypothetical protein